MLFGIMWLGFTVGVSTLSFVMRLQVFLLIFHLLYFIFVRVNTGLFTIQGRDDLLETHVVPALRERRDQLTASIGDTARGIIAQVR